MTSSKFKNEARVSIASPFVNTVFEFLAKAIRQEKEIKGI
jgi:hypothetical protein